MKLRTRIPWLLPAARNCLSSSYHNEPDLPMGIRAILFTAFFAIACFGSIPLRAENPVKEKQDRFSLAVECIKRFEGWHSSRHYPDVYKRQVYDIGREDARQDVIRIAPLEVPDFVPADTLSDMKVREMEEFFNQFNK